MAGDPIVIVFTGGSNGIGAEAVRALLKTPQPRRPWRIMIGMRKPSLDFLSPARLKETLMTRIRPNVRVKSALCAARRVTVDNEEETMQVNALSAALLVDLLWSKLDPSNADSRIVFVGSSLHMQAAKAGRITPSSIGQYGSRPNWKSMEAYTDSKLLLMHIFFLTCGRTAECDKESGSPSVTVVAVSPGFIPQTGLIRESSLPVRLAMSFIMPMAPFTRTLQQGGATVVDAILTPALRSGSYLGPKGELRAAAECYNADLRIEWEAVLRHKGVWHSVAS